MNETPRQSFAVDCCFGMPGLPHERGCLKVLDEGLPTERFAHPDAEATFKLWLRGYDAAKLDVRDLLSELMQLKDSSVNWDRLGGCEPGEIGLLLKQLQQIYFLPKRPGD